MNTLDHKPKILAPAGNKASFLAALAAGADAVYCGLKNFSARMEADNFGIEELSAMTILAHKKGVEVYIALNSVLKPNDVDKAINLVDKLSRHVKPDALIIADFAMVDIAKKAGFKGELHLSTLANMSLVKGLDWSKQNLSVSRVVLPRELNVDEIKKMAENCPKGLDLEVFIHGALCYGVSGRCYWSSYMGGKSGLRGRCVQPCRRMYTQKNESGRFFSCQDLSIDVLAKVLKSIPQISTWKIEGRKKGPHYVYYTIKAYQMLRDHGHDPAMKKTAIGLLEQALSRPTTHYNFLPQRPQNPVDLEKQTGSGLLAGYLKGPVKSPFLVPRMPLLAGDLLRIGYEDGDGHTIRKVFKSVPKKGRLTLTFKDRRPPAKSSPVFLIDRREKELEDMLNTLDAELEKIPTQSVSPSQTNPSGTGTGRKKASQKKKSAMDMPVNRALSKRIQPHDALWISKENIDKIPAKVTSDCWWWLPPVIWPEDEDTWSDLITRTVKKGGRKFVLNAPYQKSLFANTRSLDLWAGPFCNLTNASAIQKLESLNFSGAFVSFELSGDEYMALAKADTLPLGIVLTGHVPLVISRTLHPSVSMFTPFKSPKGEEAWAARNGSDVWIYPNWPLDLKAKKNELIRAGFSVFAHLHEKVPNSVTMRKRPGTWNWDLKLL